MKSLEARNESDVFKTEEEEKFQSDWSRGSRYVEVDEAREVHRGTF